MKKLFNKMSISKKIGVVFILLFFMMVIGGSVGLYNALQLAKVTERLYTDSFKRGETLSSVEKQFLSSRQEIFLHTIISDNASKAYLADSIGEHRKKIDRLLNDYRAMGIAKGHEEYYKDLLENLAKYWLIHGKVEDLSRKGQRDPALDLIVVEGDRSFTDSLNAIKKLIKDEKMTAYEAYQESEFFGNVIFVVTFIITILAIITAGALWFALTRSIVMPILTIEDSAKKIGQGNLRQRVPVMTDDEIGNLAIEFNKMADSIENYYATLENKVKERTDQLRLTNEELFEKKHELETANFGLQEANRMKSQFLANVSHELRTPLNSIIGFSELLQEKAFGDLNEKQLQYVEYVHSSGGQLLQLINNILDLSRIEDGRMDLSYEDFTVMETLGEVFGVIKPLAHKRNITVEAKTVPASPKLHADKAKFKQIMMNILSNAVKFNVDGGKIFFDWTIVEEPSGMELKRFIIFKIIDTGIGIKDEDKNKLFKEFEQIDSSITREYGGTGLGLVLTKRLVELHNGQIWVESEPDQGTKFYVKLPQGTEEIDVPAFPSSSFFSSSSPQKRPPVLIAGESSDINHLLEIYLTGGSYDVFTAADGFDLLRKSQEQKPFAIIMGITIPKKDGWEVLKELKSNPETVHIPVIIISSIDNRELGYSLGALEYLEKPVSREKLLNVLEKLQIMTNPKKAILKVLLTGMEPEIFDGAAGLLEKEGCSVCTLKTGNGMAKEVAELEPDLIALRIRLREKADLSPVKELGDFASERKIPILIFTQDNPGPDIRRLLDSGVKIIISQDNMLGEMLLSEIRSVQNV